MKHYVVPTSENRRWQIIAFWSICHRLVSTKAGRTMSGRKSFCFRASNWSLGHKQKRQNTCAKNISHDKRQSLKCAWHCHFELTQGSLAFSAPCDLRLRYTLYYIPIRSMESATSGPVFGALMKEMLSRLDWPHLVFWFWSSGCGHRQVVAAYRNEID